MASKKIEQTRQEKDTAAVKQRIESHLDEYYSKLRNKKEYPVQDISYVTAEYPFELWSYSYCANEDDEPDMIWLLWNGDEMVSYDDPNDVIIDILTQKRERESFSKLKYWTSPLSVAAIIALLLTVVVSVLSYLDKMSPQLWTIFTAVIAFYFGRNNLKISKPEDIDS